MKLKLLVSIETILIIISTCPIAFSNTINSYENLEIKINPTDMNDLTKQIINKNDMIIDIWQEEAKLNASDGESLDMFGHSVSIDGDYALVGMPNDDNFTGSAYIFSYDGSTWSEETKLTASDGAKYDIFGISVAINGNYAVIGACTNDEDTLDYAGLGSVYVFVRDGSSWTEEAILTASDGEIGDYFGFSVAFDGNYIIIGAPGDDDFQGSVYVFTRNLTTWTETTKLTASDGASGEMFGNSVSFNGNYLLVGAPDIFNDEIGSAYVFLYDGMNWTEEARLNASDGIEGNWFGGSVSIIDDYALIGASEPWEEGLGCVYVFTRDGTTWTEETKLTSSDGEPRDWFGESVVIIGNYAFVGAYGDENAQGSVYIFSRDGTTWTEEMKLTASDGQSYDGFGRSISISRNRILIGAFGDDDYIGSAYIFSMPPADLVCEGSLIWDDVKPGDTVTGDFEIVNQGDPNSSLNWEIQSFPNWGNWTFYPDSGAGLGYGESVTVNVEVVSPEEPKTEFEGEVVIVNAFDSDDFYTIQVSLTTHYNYIPNFLLRKVLMELFPILQTLPNF